MPIRDDDLHNRLRGSSRPEQRRQYISDVRNNLKRSFPGVGSSLPPRPMQPAPVPVTGSPSARPSDAVGMRPRQPLLQRQAVPQPVRRMSTPAQTQQAARLRAATPERAAMQASPAATTAEPAQQSRPRAKTKKPGKKLLTKGRIIFVCMLILVLAGGWMATKVLSNVSKVFHGSVFSVLTTTKLKGEDDGRVNILVAGNSADDPGHNGAQLTDSIMLVSIDVRNNTAFMLSIPRDLWVEIPGYGHAKINEAYVDGENGNFSAAGYPSGGMGLLEEVVQQNFGVKSNYYALINYNALKDGVDAVGGVDITVKSDDPRGWYDPSIDWGTHGPLVKLSNGSHHLTGEQALDLSRARGDAPGSYGFPRADFDRTEHQRMLILALKQKVLSAGTLANPLALSGLFDTLGANVKTDFSLGDVRRLYDISKGINNGSIQSIGLNDANGVNMLASYTSPAGQSALIPAAGMDDFTKIQAFLARIMTNNPIVREGATVVVLNGTNTTGLAAQAEKMLEAKDITVGDTGNAPASQTTTIIDASDGSKPATLSLLENEFTHATVTTTNPYAGKYQADFVVIIGADWTPTTATTDTSSQ